MHSVLVIGCGGIGERHLRCFARTGRARVSACDSDPVVARRMAEKYGVPVSGDWREALAGDIDTVVVCTPAHLHVPIAAEVLAAGRHVLIEKPLSNSLEGVDSLIEARNRAGRQAAVAYVYRVFPYLANARAHLATGVFGPVLQATVTSGQPFDRLRPDYARTYYRDRMTGGGAVQDALTHSANWIEWAVGPADSVLSDCAHLALPGVEVEDTVHVSARHGDALVSYALNQFQAPNETVIQLNAARGSVRIELHRRRWGAFPAGAQDWIWQETPEADRDSCFTDQAGAFLDQIDGAAGALCSLEAAARTLRFNLAVLASARTGARVDCGGTGTHG